MANKIPPPPPGQSPLGDDSAPKWGGPGGGDQVASVYAWGDFRNMFGRNPTASELAQLSRAYVGSDRNVANTAGGKAAIAAYFDQSSNSPDQQQEDQDAKLKDKIPQQYEAVKQTFQQSIGRAPSQEELDHFSTMIAKGDADAYSIGQGLRTLPEYTNAQDETARGKLRGELQAADTDYLTKQVAPALQSQFAQQGRVADSSSQALASALANAAKATNDQREQYMATVGREDYTNSRQATINNYLQTLQRQYQLNDTGTARKYQLQDQNTARTNEVNDYYTQQQAYNDYLQNYGRRSQGSGTGGILAGGMTGGISGASTGAMVGGPYGALIGGIAGAGLGAYSGAQRKGIY